MEYPVLIGSAALREYNYVNDKINDYDLIVNDEQARKICFECDKKEKLMCFYGTDKIDLIMAEKSDYDIYDYCNKNVTKYIEIFNIKCIVCPLELLYVIKKSHVHRILPLTNNNSQNIDIWYHHINMYNWMRRTLDYHYLDEVLYRKHELTKVETVMKNVFTKRFDEVTQKFGDTAVSMSKDNLDFFKDNVERFIEHDELHVKIAELCRQTDELLFNHFKKDINQAELDEELFINSDANLRNQCIFEELMVLLLERKWIPEMMACYVNQGKTVTSYNLETKKYELREIIAHFVTNLCGQGDYWLRRYVLDHVDLWKNMEVYQFNKLFKITVEITNAKTIEANFKNKTLLEMINVEYIDYNYLIDQFENLEKNYNYHYRDDDYDYTIHSAIHVNDFSEYTTLNYHLPYDAELYKNYIELVLVDYNKIIYDDHDSYHIFYNMNKQIGIIIESNPKFKISIFTGDVNKSYNDKIKIEGNLFVLNKMNDNHKSFDNDYAKEYKTFYYYSSDNSCGWRNKNYVDKYSYISSYGDAPKLINQLFEKISRHCLKTDAQNYNDARRKAERDCGEDVTSSEY